MMTRFGRLIPSGSRHSLCRSRRPRRTMGSVRRFATGVPWPVLLAGALTAAGCGRRSAPVTIRLVDLFKPELVLGRSPAPPAPPPRMEWRFDASPGGKGVRSWEAGPGVAGLEVHDGRLQGRS